VVTAVLIIAGTQTKNFLQIANSLSNIDKELSSFIVRFLVGLPFILLIAAAGGLFLANTALKPIVAMQHLAEHVREDSLSDRLHYQGPSDEFGSLAATFDSMLDRLEASFAREKRFSADAAHELKTPLTALKGKLEVALSRPRTAKEYKEAMATMKADVDRLISLSADLLLLSRMGNVALSSRAEKIDVGELLDSCVDQIITVFPNKHVMVKKDYEHHVEIEGVRDYLVRLFLNILDNAVKFSNAEVMLLISIKRVQARKAAIIEIGDNGPGIPTSEIPYLFQPFYRVESDRSRLKGGAGLGLAIAHEIAEAHGGQIEISSVLGKGTNVTIALPLSLKQ
jgi:signal transduction histidine kinase